MGWLLLYKIWQVAVILLLLITAVVWIYAAIKKKDPFTAGPIMIGVTGFVSAALLGNLLALGGAIVYIYLRCCDIRWIGRLINSKTGAVVPPRFCLCVIYDNLTAHTGNVDFAILACIGVAAVFLVVVSLRVEGNTQTL